MDWSEIITALGLGYVFGSIPTGYILTILGSGEDIRTIGSGGIGATNVLRTGRKILAIATLIGDGVKAMLAITLAAFFLGENYIHIAGFAAFIGHLYPVWLRFQGGKGIAVYGGILLALNLWGALSFLLLYALIVSISRISSLASLAGASVAPFVLWGLSDIKNAQLAGVLTILTFWAHRENIKRLFAGQEPRIGEKQKNQDNKS